MSTTNAFHTEHLAPPAAYRSERRRVVLLAGGLAAGPIAASFIWLAGTCR